MPVALWNALDFNLKSLLNVEVLNFPNLLSMTYGSPLGKGPRFSVKHDLCFQDRSFSLELLFDFKSLSKVELLFDLELLAEVKMPLEFELLI